MPDYVFKFLMFAVLALVGGYYAYKAYKVHKANRLIARLAGIDESWEPAGLKGIIEKLYTMVKYAIEAGTVERVQDLMSERLYERLKGKTAAQFGFRPADSFSITLSTSIKLVEVIDFNDDSRDRLGVYVSFPSISFLRNSSGPPSEYWTLARDGDGWVVDDINPSAGISDLVRSRSYSEELSLKDAVADIIADTRNTAPVYEKTVEAVEAPREVQMGRKEYHPGRKDY